MNDHWGYYNGSAYTIGTDYAGYYYQRMPNSSLLTKGMLSRITYPTGGYTDFLFDANSYSQIVTDDRTGLISETGTAGGVRINKITSYDGTNSVVTSFKYVIDYALNHLSTASSGILTCKPKYYWPDWTVSDGILGEYYSESVFSINSMIPLANYSGTHIGYSEIAEIRNDGSYTLHKFSNYENTTSDFKDKSPLCGFHSTYSPYSSYIDKSLMRGKLLSESVYNSNNLLVKELLYSYRSDTSNMYTNYILGTNSSYSQLCPTLVTNPFYVGSAYKIYYFDYDQKQEETKDYLAGGTVSKITTYTKEDKPLTNPIGYSDLRLLKSSTNYLSDRNITTNYYYPTDLTTQSNVQGLIDKFRIDEPIKTISLSSGGTGTTNIGVNKTTFKISSGLVVKDKEYYSKTDESNLEQVMSYDAYNSTGVLQQYTASNGIPVSLLWDNSKNYLKAKIENATYTQVSAQDGQSMTSDSKILSDNIKSLVPNAISSTYSYSPFVGMTSQTDPTGIITKYTYDLFGRLARISDFKGNILKEYYYHFSNQPTTIANYYNAVRSQNFYKQNCAANSTPVAYPYTVPANTYSSNVSQDDANSQAQNDINVNGQNAANSLGICRYSNLATSGNFYNQNCVAGSVAALYNYSVPAGKYFSEQSIDDANQQATNEINANGQNAANANGVCFYLNVDTPTLTFSSSGGMIKISVTSNTTYTVSISANTEWIPFGTSTTGGNSTFNISCNENTTGSSRSGILTIKSISSYGNITKIITINQSANYFLNVNTPTLTYSSSGGTQPISITTNTAYTISSNTTWIPFSPYTTGGNSTFNISCNENTTGASRSGTVTVKSLSSYGNLTKIITINQAAAIPPVTFTASPTALSFLFIDAAKTVSVTCSTAWSVSGNTGGFITATVINANTLSLKCSKNFGADRTGTVTITDGSNQIIIYVTQYSAVGPPP